MVVVGLMAVVRRLLAVVRGLLLCVLQKSSIQRAERGHRQVAPSHRPQNFVTSGPRATACLLRRRARTGAGGAALVGVAGSGAPSGELRVGHRLRRLRVVARTPVSRTLVSRRLKFCRAF